MKHRGYFAIHSLEELTEEESIRCLCPCEAALPEQTSEPLAEFVQEHGAGVLNLAFQRAFPWLLSQATQNTLALRSRSSDWAMLAERF